MRGAIREGLSTFLLALLIFALLQVTLETREVQLSSMKPSLLEGQYLVINKVVYYFHPPRRGEVIVFHYPKNPGLVYIKRVIGLPGDAIEIKEGKVHINGIYYDEPYVSGDTAGALAMQIVSPKHYFVMGDNRNSSSDSRHWGTVPRPEIIGKAWLCYWPPSEWGLAPNYSFDSQPFQVHLNSVGGAASNSEMSAS